jgi:hypothetical protein
MRSEALALLLLACSATTNQPLNAQQLSEFQGCSVNSDCALEINGCCCATVSINKAKEDEFGAQFSCTVLCPCAAEWGNAVCPVCVQGACAMVAPDAGAACPQ